MKQLLSLFLVLFLSILSLNSEAQYENSKWYFGGGVGLDFMTSPPTVLTNGALSTMEGCSTMSDGSGNLLFYSDGITVWNKTHAPMANGTGLQGHTSTTQSALIVKQPGNSNIYYLFTLGTGGSGGGPLCYSIVDISLAAGMGSVTIKNVSLTVSSREKLAAVRHCNGVDIWILSHDRPSNDFRVYLLTGTGLSTVPLFSAGGTPSPLEGTGYIKASPTGRKLALCTGSVVSLYDFDIATGLASNALDLGTVPHAYGCEFSPDGTKLYAAGWTGPSDPTPVHQWDLCAGSSTAIVASHNVVDTAKGTISLGGFQLALDGKIYIGRYFSNEVSVINNPNVYGAGCNFVNLGLSLSPKSCRYALQNCINDFLKPVAPLFTYTVNCTSVSFSAPQASTAGICSGKGIAVSQTWTFGEPASNAANSSTLANPTHMYSTIGTYTVKLVTQFPCSTDTTWQPITIVSGCVNTQELTAEENLKSYPNPVNSNLNLIVQTRLKAIIFNQMGSILFEGVFDPGVHTIDMTSFPDGIYTLKSATIKSVKTTRIIKMK